MSSRYRLFENTDSIIHAKSCKGNDLHTVIDDLIENFEKKDENLFAYFGYATREKYTDLYFYGKSFEEMKKIVEEYAKNCPLCEKSRIKQDA